MIVEPGPGQRAGRDGGRGTMPELSGSEPAAILTAIKTEAVLLEGYLEGRSEAELARPSACEGWSNADVVAHLTWAAEYFGGLLARALQGDVSPPANLPPPGPDRRLRVAERAR